MFSTVSEGTSVFFFKNIFYVLHGHDHDISSTKVIKPLTMNSIVLKSETMDSFVSCLSDNQLFDIIKKN